MIENWKVKSATYFDKKKNKLWITVLIEDINNYLEENERNNFILCLVEFVANEQPIIKSSILNNSGTKSVKLTEDQNLIVIQAATDKSKQYLK